MPYDPQNRFGSKFSRIYWKKKFAEERKKKWEAKKLTYNWKTFPKWHDSDTETMKDILVWVQNHKAELREKYRKLCETRIQNIGDDWQAFLIEEILNAEAEEIFGE